MTETTLPAFNPSGDMRVEVVKKITEDVIKYLHDNMPDNRERAIAITNYEQACMWAVKSLFVK